jgi:hypothetical protein
MSNTTNDERILELKKQIQAKKEKLGKTKRFAPVTNCSLELNGQRTNIQTLMSKDLVAIMVSLNSLLLSAKDLGVEDEYEINGYKVQEWMDDVKARLDILSRKKEEQALKLMEGKLLKLLSERKKVELEIDEIESLLKD